VTFDTSLEQTLEIDLVSGSSSSKDSGDKGASSGGGGEKPSDKPGGGGGGGGGDGFLIANTHPWAKVFIDGKDSGKTTPIGPRDRIPVKPGKHTITFVANDKRVNVDVVIKAGEESKIVRDLNSD
jgi:hypothetical protein